MNSEVKVSIPDQNDRIMAALAHVTILLPMMGFIAPIIIWTTQKEKSKFVSYQALQATVYQISIILGWFLGMALYMCSFFVTFLFIPFADSSQSTSPIFAVGFVFPFIVMGGIMIFGILYVLYGLFGAIQVFQGKDFRYAVFGRWLDRYLDQS